MESGGNKLIVILYTITFYYTSVLLKDSKVSVNSPEYEQVVTVLVTQHIKSVITVQLLLQPS